MKKTNLALQIVKFAAVGGVNTAVDLIVLNILMFVTGIASGVFYSVFKGISFLVAVTNSYIMNKRWTFGSREKKVGKEFSQFLLISVVGFAINVGAASVVVNLIPNFLDISPKLWGNVGALAGTFCGLLWNFIGYKFIVFKK